MHVGVTKGRMHKCVRRVKTRTMCDEPTSAMRGPKTELRYTARYFDMPDQGILAPTLVIHILVTVAKTDTKITTASAVRHA